MEVAVAFTDTGESSDSRVLVHFKGMPRKGQLVFMDGEGRQGRFRILEVEHRVFPGYSTEEPFVVIHVSPAKLAKII